MKVPFHKHRSDAGLPVGGPVKTTQSGTIDKTTEVKPADRIDAGTVSAPGASTQARKLDFDPVAQLPAHAEIGASPEAVQAVTDALADVAAGCKDATAKRILEKAIGASKKAAQSAQVDAPLRVSLKEDPSRPSTIEGMLQRRVKGVGANKRTTLLFRPRNKDFQPFPVPAALIEGLPTGARLSLQLDRTEGGKQQYKVVASDSEYATSMLGNVVVEDGKAYVEGRGHRSPYGRVPLEGPGAVALAGQAVLAEIQAPSDPDRVARVKEKLGTTDAQSASFLEIAAEAGCPLAYPADVVREVNQIAANPRIEGKDLTHLPFCTIDFESSMDLDQAMCIQRRDDGGYDVHYAIADAAHFIKKGGALDRWAERRSLTTYLPDRSLPILPKVLSEDLCSLVEGKDRRAFVVSTRLDANGDVVGDSTFQRGVVNSRAKLHYNGVQAFHDAGKKGELAGHDYSETLGLLREVGELRMATAKKRGVVPGNYEKTHVAPGGEAGEPMTIAHENRKVAEKWNEQISLLANEEVGRYLMNSGVKTLHRVQPPPDPESVAAFRDQVGKLGVPWSKDVPLDEYVRGLDGSKPLSKAILRLIARTNRPASYSTEATGHNALKLDAYDHFTAPMRRYTDIVTHRVLAALVEGRTPPYQKGGALDRIAAKAQQAKRREADVGRTCHNLVAAQTMADSVGDTFGGMVVALQPTGAVVALDEPPVEVMVRANAIGATLAEEATVLAGPEAQIRLGQRIEVKIDSVDAKAGRVDAVPANDA